MASTYAFPSNPSTRTHSHRHARSHYSSDRRPSWNGAADGPSPLENGPLPSANGHRPHRSDMDGQLALPYVDSHDPDHDHTSERSRSFDGKFSMKPFMGRSKGRPRGESDLMRPQTRKSATSGKFGFSPIQETPTADLPFSSSSWLELPEALTALLIPLPYMFASLAYPSIIAQNRRTGILGGLPGESEFPRSHHIPHGVQLLHACILSSTTLIWVGIISKIRMNGEQPLDRRKSFGSSGQPVGMFGVTWDASSFGHIVTNILSILLPFHATMQLGGAKTALVLLTGFAAGLGRSDQQPGKHTLWDTCKRTFRTRKTTFGTLALGLLLDTLNSVHTLGTLLGHLSLLVSVFIIPPPLPSTPSVMTGTKPGNGSWNPRSSLSKPISPLTSSPEEAILTTAAGLLLTVVTMLFSIMSSASPWISHYTILFSTLSIASATALAFFAFPAALRRQKKAGFGLGCVVVSAFCFLQTSIPWQDRLFVSLLSIVLFGAVSFDTSAIGHSQSHGHTHSGHTHAHSPGDHHLHGNHSKLSAFLIARCTPGSIIHSILIEKDSRRIAYFGILNLGFMLVQFFYGYVSGSLGLLTDSIHMLFDCAGLAVGLAAAVMSKWRPNIRFPYGFGKVDTLSGFANGVFLMLVSLEIIFDAFERLSEGHELQRLNELLIVSILGFLVNIVGLTAFGHAHHGHGHSHDHDHAGHDHSHGHSHDNENLQGIFLHILADALGSVAVIISTLLTKYYGWSGWDPIASCIIAVLIFVSAIPLVKSSGMRLLLSLPADIEYKLRNTLQELSSLRDVVGYTVPKFWLEDEGAAHSEVHAKEHEGCGHSHSHPAHGHEHSHSNHGSSNGSVDAHHGHHHHGHSHDHDHDHDHHDHHHNHDHDHAPRQQKVLGVIHVIASQSANLEDVRERTVMFLKARGVDVVVHVEKEGEGRCWCGGGNKMG